MRNPYMKFQNPSMHGSKVTLCIKKHATYKCPKLQRAITHDIFFRIYSKVNQVIYSSIPIYSQGFKALASIVFEIFCWQDFIHIFSKDDNSEKGHNPDGEKKQQVSYLFMRNPYVKFQNPSIHGSEVMLCIKKHNGQTDGHTNVPEAICPSNFFEVGGIMNTHNKCFSWTNKNKYSRIITKYYTIKFGFLDLFLCHLCS